MKIINFNLKEFRNLLGYNTTIGNGFFGKVLFREDLGILFKVDRNVYDNICPDYDYPTIDDMTCIRDFSNRIDENQIEYYSSVQSKVSLTKLPYGIIRCNGVNAAILLPYHRYYINMGKVFFTKTELRKNLEMLLERIRELELNEIVQTDLACNFDHGCEYDFLTNELIKRGDLNIVISNNDMQLIDLDGGMVKYKNMNNVYDMYLEFIKILDIYNDLDRLGFDSKRLDYQDKTMNYEKAKSIFDSYKKML